MTQAGAPTRRVRLLAPGRVALEETPPRPPGPGEVEIALEAALTGGTVLKIVRRGTHARLGAAPLTLGHEGVGRIVRLGAGVTGWTVGDRVLPGPSAPCGACPACRREREPLCEQATWWCGLFADRAIVPAGVVARSLHRVPAGLVAERAALADNLACVLHGMERTPGGRGDRALVLGSGPLGLLWTHALCEAGADVTLASRRAESAREGARFGAARTAALEALGAGERFDLVVEAVGRPETWERALAHAARGARVNLFGGVPAGAVLPVDATRLHYEELLVTASFHYAPRHLAAALARLASGLTRAGADLTGALIGERVELADLPAWLERAAAGPAPKKAVVVPA